MKFPVFIFAMMGGLASSFAQGVFSQSVVDPLLGEPFRATYFDAGENNKYQATLVSYPFDGERPKAAVLYIHGFNDYYFQKQTAKKLDSAGYAFFAIDLHNYGRSYRKGQVLGELRHLDDYFPELDSALVKIRQSVGDSVPVVLLGHSTGGLVSLVYAAARENGKNIDAIILNSPFLEMNFPWIVRDVLVPLVAPIGHTFPNIPIPRSVNDNYSESLLKNHKGEWSYDTTLKVNGSIPIDLGWAAAIHDGQKVVQAGMEIESPILVMHSNCSAKGNEWSDEYTHCDGVLNVEHIRNYGAHLGPDVRLVQIQDGLHDLYLSRPEAREKAYRVTIEFLDGNFN